MTSVRHVTATELRAALSPAAAVAAITETLLDGFDPADDFARSVVGTANGQFLLMPSEAGAFAGVKIVSVVPGNPELSLPRIQAMYLLYDAASLTLLATFDGVALTNLRTPAVSFAAVRPALDRLDEPPRVVVFGAGPQSIAHIDAFRSVVTTGLADTTFVVRQPDRVASTVHHLGTVAQSGSVAAMSALAHAHVVICATTARTPLFGSSDVSPHTIVIAVGSHEPDARELGGEFVGSATVIVEDVDTARREAGDVVMALSEGFIEPTDLVPMRNVISESARLARDRPVVFKSVGMPWQDLSIATAVLAALGN